MTECSTIKVFGSGSKQFNKGPTSQSGISCNYRDSCERCDWEDVQNEWVLKFRLDFYWN